ncbi:MAG: hypothetical protein ABWZ99_15495 [Ilumatobacteraceae bacterium]
MDDRVRSRLRALLELGKRQGLNDLNRPPPGLSTSGLDAPTDALVRLAALVGLSGPPAAYEGIVNAGRRYGITDDQFIGTLLAVAPTVGISRLVTATTHVSRALGYDLDEAFEGLDPLSDAPSFSPRERG